MVFVYIILICWKSLNFKLFEIRKEVAYNFYLFFGDFFRRFYFGFCDFYLVIFELLLRLDK